MDQEREGGGGKEAVSTVWGVNPGKQSYSRYLYTVQPPFASARLAFGYAKYAGCLSDA